MHCKGMGDYAREREMAMWEETEEDRQKAEFEEAQEYKEFLRWKKLRPKRAKRWRNIKKMIGNKNETPTN
jgi:hypothetical protein